MSWPKVKLSNLALPTDGSFVDGPFGSNLKAAEYITEGVPIVRLQNIRPNHFLMKDIKFISPQKAAELSRHNYGPGDLVISKLGDPPGYACVVPIGAGSGIIVADVVRFRGNPELVDHRYLSYFLNSPDGRREFLSLSKGTTRTRVNLTSIKTIEVPLPPTVDEQKRIASVLDKVDALCRQRVESLRLAEKLIQSIFIDMFGNPVTNPKGWPLLPLAELGTLDRGVSKHRPRNAPELLGGKYPLIQTGEVANAGLYIREFKQTYSEAGFNQSKMWPKGTLCITIAANIARTGILDFDACFPDSVVGFVPHESVSTSVYVHFLFGFLQSILERNAPQAAQKNINLAILRALEVPTPPYHLQKDFDVIVAKVIKILDDQNTSLRFIDAVFSSVQQRAFHGELDLSRVRLDSQVEDSTFSDSGLSASQSARPEGKAFLIPPIAIESELERLATLIGQDGPMPWSADYFKYRVLGTMPAPFSFDDLMERVSGVFNEEPPYEEIKGIILGLLGQGGGPALLRQRFDLTVDEGTNEVTGRKQIVFEPAP
jgi:type I restriction enzyme, S subunit